MKHMYYISFSVPLLFPSFFISLILCLENSFSFDLAWSLDSSAYSKLLRFICSSLCCCLFMSMSSLSIHGALFDLTVNFVSDPCLSATSVNIFINLFCAFSGFPLTSQSSVFLACTTFGLVEALFSLDKTLSLFRCPCMVWCVFDTRCRSFSLQDDNKKGKVLTLTDIMTNSPDWNDHFYLRGSIILKDKVSWWSRSELYFASTWVFPKTEHNMRKFPSAKTPQGRISAFLKSSCFSVFTANFFCHFSCEQLSAAPWMQL